MRWILTGNEFECYNVPEKKKKKKKQKKNVRFRVRFGSFNDVYFSSLQTQKRME